MKVKSPQSIYLKGHRQQAVLLLHSFTGTVRDVKHLAQQLNEEGFTCYVPSYPGHGLPLKEFTKHNINDWWEQVTSAYQFLRNEGYSRINVTGVSLGGLFTLRLAEHFDLERIAVMSAPHKKRESEIAWRLERYGHRMNEILSLSEEERRHQMETILSYDKEIEVFQGVIDEIMACLANITVPVNIMYGEEDDPLYAQSAQYIYDNVNSQDKELLKFEKSGHLMTYGDHAYRVEQSIIQFFSK